MKDKLYFVYNPLSGKGQIKAHLFDIVSIFAEAGYDIAIHPTSARRDAYNEVLRHAAESDIIVCSGGDGTLNETVSALMDYASANRPARMPKLGYIPAGTTNDFASSLGISKNMTEAARSIIDGKDFLCDIGGFNEKYFAYIAAFGAFTDVSYETPQQTKNILGHMAYLLEGIKRLPALQSFHLTAEHDSETVEGDFIYGMVSNTTSVGGFKTSGALEIMLNDGLFEVLLIRTPENMYELHSIVSSLLKRDFSSDLFYTAHTGCITIRSDDDIPWTLDGEFGGSRNEIFIKNHRNAIAIKIPEEDDIDSAATEEPAEDADE